MSADVRVAVVIAAVEHSPDAERICRLVSEAAPYCRVQIHTVAGEGGLDVRALHSDIVLYLPGTGARANAALIDLRERAGFSVRLAEPQFARVWFSPNRRRSLYVVGAMPGAFATLAFALELGCGDIVGAERLRRLSSTPRPGYVVPNAGGRDSGPHRSPRRTAPTATLSRTRP